MVSKYKITNVEYICTIWVCYMNISRIDRLSVALEQKLRTSKTQTYPRKHSNPNKSKKEAKSDDRDNYYVQYFSVFLLQYLKSNS